jgi:hypothetical protein
MLIPRHLVVTDEAFRAGLPGEPLVAQLTANGNHEVPATPAGPAGLAGQGSGSGFTDLGGMPGLGQTPGVRISGPLRRSQGSVPERPERSATNGASGPGATNGASGPGPDELPRRHHDQPGRPAGSARASAQSPADAGATPFGMPPSSFDVFSPRQPQAPGDTPEPADAGPGTPSPGSGAYIPSPQYPAAGSSPFAGPGAASFPAGGASYPDQPAPFPGWTLHNTPGAPAGLGGPAGPTTPMTPVASPRPGQAAGPPWELSRETGPLPAVPGSAGSGGPNGPAAPSSSEPGADGDLKGLPRRVRQASLAPQLRDNPPPRRTTLASSGAPGGVPRSPAPSGSPGSPGSSGPSPDEIRQTMSSLQRGWQEGRSRRIAEQAAGESPGAGPGTPADAGPDTAPGNARNSTANEEARGGSDGS